MGLVLGEAKGLAAAEKVVDGGWRAYSSAAVSGVGAGILRWEPAPLLPLTPLCAALPAPLSAGDTMRLLVAKEWPPVLGPSSRLSEMVASVERPRGCWAAADDLAFRSEIWARGKATRCGRLEPPVLPPSCGVLLALKLLYGVLPPENAGLSATQPMGAAGVRGLSSSSPARPAPAAP